MTKQKAKGQYMTPKAIVDLILNTVSYQGKTILRKKILEPSFGSGAFLVKILERLYSEAQKAGLPNDAVAELFEQNVCGFEKDEQLYQRAIARLNNFCRHRKIPFPVWRNLHCADAFDVYTEYIGKMDYVVGNPPFIRVHHMDERMREVSKTLEFAGGTTDMYVMFYEIGLRCLDKQGSLCYISPNSFFKNTSVQRFRDYLLENRLLTAIFDFQNSRIFDGAETYSCIIRMDKGDEDANDITIRTYKSDTYNQFTVPYYFFTSAYLGKGWCLCEMEDIQFLKANAILPRKLKDLCTIQNGCATQKDDVFVVKVYTDAECTCAYMGTHFDAEQTVYIQRKGKVYPIESTALHRAVKASRFDGQLDNTYIVFPYAESVGCGFVPLTETAFSELYPLAYDYLSLFKDELMNRDADDNAEWFQFGRGQGLSNSNRQKLVFRHIIDSDTTALTSYLLPEDVIVYSGLYTVADKNLPMITVQNIFSSKELMHYLRLTGKSMSGGYIAVSAKLMQNYGVRMTGKLNQ